MLDKILVASVGLLALLTAACAVNTDVEEHLARGQQQHGEQSFKDVQRAPQILIKAKDDSNIGGGDAGRGNPAGRSRLVGRSGRGKKQRRDKPTNRLALSGRPKCKRRPKALKLQQYSGSYQDYAPDWSYRPGSMPVRPGGWHGGPGGNDWYDYDYWGTGGYWVWRPARPRAPIRPVTDSNNAGGWSNGGGSGGGEWGGFPGRPRDPHEPGNSNADGSVNNGGGGGDGSTGRPGGDGGRGSDSPGSTEDPDGASDNPGTLNVKPWRPESTRGTKRTTRKRRTDKLHNIRV